MSIQKKFKAGDRVVWDDLGYQDKFFAHTDPKQILTVSHYGDEDDGEDGLVFFENLSDINGDQVGVFDHRFTPVESAQESAETPSNQGKTCSQNCVSCKDKQTPLLEDKDENEWFKRGELPPVGANIEYKLGAGIWFPAVVKYVLDTFVKVEGEVVVYCPHLKCEMLIVLNEDTSIRPIKSPEQIAEEEREKAVTYMINRFSGLSKAHAVLMYDAGYRLVGGVK